MRPHAVAETVSPAENWRCTLIERGGDLIVGGRPSGAREQVEDRERVGVLDVDAERLATGVLLFDPVAQDLERHDLVVGGPAALHDTARPTTGGGDRRIAAIERVAQAPRRHPGQLGQPYVAVLQRMAVEAAAAAELEQAGEAALAVDEALDDGLEGGDRHAMGPWCSSVQHGVAP